MTSVYNLDLRMFPVLIRNEDSGEMVDDTIVLTKQQLQASCIVGQSSKELIHRLYSREGYTVLDIGRPKKRSVCLELSTLWEW